MGVNSLPKTVSGQRRDCDLNPGPSAPESSTLTNRLPSHPYAPVYWLPLLLLLLRRIYSGVTRDLGAGQKQKNVLQKL